MFLPPKSSHQNHDIHPWNCCSDDRKWFDTSRKKCNEIIPISNHMNQLSYPLYRIGNPTRFHERDDNNHKCENRKKNCKKFREECKCFFNHKRKLRKYFTREISGEYRIQERIRYSRKPWKESTKKIPFCKGKSM